MRLLSERDVERLIDPASAIAAAAEAYRLHSAGALPPPGRIHLTRRDPKGGALVLAGYAGRLFAMKSNVHAYADPAAERRSAASLLILWDSVACVPLALIPSTALNDHRTAAGFAAAAQRLAPSQARTLAVYGTGKVAPATLRYLAGVRPFERALIVGRTHERARAFAERARAWPELAGIAVEADADAARAAQAADVIATVTTSDVPLFPGGVVKPGTFVILGGANRPHAREADDVLIARTHIWADHRDGCLERAGDLVVPLASGALALDRIRGEIGELLARLPAPARPEGLRPDADVTVFKSIGIAAQDVVLAEMVLARAERDGVGVDFDPVEGTTRSVSAVLAGAQP
jgi:alanine dehydrogenase